MRVIFHVSVIVSCLFLHSSICEISL